MKNVGVPETLLRSPMPTSSATRLRSHGWRSIFGPRRCLAGRRGVRAIAVKLTRTAFEPSHRRRDGGEHLRLTRGLDLRRPRVHPVARGGVGAHALDRRFDFILGDEPVAVLD